jgi:hypothetical protein
MTDTYCLIYGLFDPDTGNCGYLGKTTNLKARLANHLSQALHGSLPRNVWIRSLSKAPLVQILDWSPLVWQESERWWIKEMRQRGHLLTNVAEGGSGGGMIGLRHSLETRKKMSISRAGHKPSLGYKHTEETRHVMRLRGLMRPPIFLGNITVKKVKRKCARLYARL